MMTLDEMKLAVCENLPDIINVVDRRWGDNDGSLSSFCQYYWKWPANADPARVVNWPTEGLQVCHEAENLLNTDQQYAYHQLLFLAVDCRWTYLSTTEKRLEAICRVWWPERFEQ